MHVADFSVIFFDGWFINDCRYDLQDFLQLFFEKLILNHIHIIIIILVLSIIFENELKM